jgi:arginase
VISVKKYEIFGAPFDFAAGTQGDSLAPSYLREHGLSMRIGQRIRNWGAGIIDSGDVTVNNDVKRLVEEKEILKAVELYCNCVYDRASNAYNAGHIPVVIGGDHSIATGTIAAASNYLLQERQSNNLGVIWVDAHADLSDRTRGNIHGKVAASILGISAHNELNNLGGKFPKVKPENIIFIGIADLMPNENAILRAHDIEVYGIDKIQCEGINTILTKAITKLETTSDAIYLSFDIDACDGGVYRGCATPEIGGLSGREAIEVAYRIGQSEKFIGADIVEFNPNDDIFKNTDQLVVKLIDAVLGYRI